MLELMTTRHRERVFVDRALAEPEFLALDELHTYTERQDDIIGNRDRYHVILVSTPAIVSAYTRNCSPICGISEPGAVKFAGQVAR